jgi:hypothetical protein
MKTIKKLLLLLLTVVLVFSCSQEEILDSPTDTADLAIDVRANDNSNIGPYIGTFRAFDPSERGIIEANVVADAPSVATLRLASGTTYELESTANVTHFQNTKLYFVAVGESAQEVSFKLAVNKNGSGIEMTNLIIGNRETSVITIK